MKEFQQIDELLCFYMLDIVNGSIGNDRKDTMLVKVFLETFKNHKKTTINEN